MMSTVDDLLRGVSNAIGNGIPLSLTNTSKDNDCYEAYILGMVINAAKCEGGRITYEYSNGKPATEFVFRTSPGYIFSTRRDYTHAVIEFDNAPSLEAHMSVRYIGKSGVAHECDVSVLSRQEAQICRRHSSIPVYSALMLAIECKYYEGSRVAIGLARGFLGLTSEIGKENNYFVVNTLSDNAAIILEKHNHNYEEGVYPGQRQEERLLVLFQKEFARYRVRSRIVVYEKE